MPISFAQPDPQAPAITAGAAAAEYEAKTFPAIASIFENAARLRAQAGSGGGGHGGPVATGGPVQVLPSGSPDATYQVEAQANREQRALDLGFEAGQDPVSKHIALTSQYQQQRDQEKQDGQLKMMDILNNSQGARQPAQPEQEPQPVVFTDDDKQQLDATMQQVGDVRKALENRSIPEATYYQLMAPIQQQREALLKKQQQAQADAEKQKNQAEVRQSLHQTALVVSQGRGLVSHLPSARSDVEGTIPDRFVPDGRGNWKNVNEPKQLQQMKTRDTRALKQMELEWKSGQAKDTTEQRYEKIRGMALKELSDTNSGKGPPSGAQIAAKMQEIRDHLEEWKTGKKPQVQQDPGVPQDKFDSLMNSLMGTPPGGAVPKAERQPSTSQQLNQGTSGLGGGDQFGGMGGSW